MRRDVESLLTKCGESTKCGGVSTDMIILGHRFAQSFVSEIFLKERNIE